MTSPTKSPESAGRESGEVPGRSGGGHASRPGDLVGDGGPWLCECPVCDCRNARYLNARVKGALVCPPCVLGHKLQTDDIAKPHELEAETRKRMQKRKGTSAHLVRNGMS